MLVAATAQLDRSDPEVEATAVGKAVGHGEGFTDLYASWVLPSSSRRAERLRGLDGLATGLR